MRRDLVAAVAKARREREASGEAGYASVTTLAQYAEGWIAGRKLRGLASAESNEPQFELGHPRVDYARRARRCHRAGVVREDRSAGSAELAAADALARRRG